MFALFNNVAVFDDQNNVRIADGGQTVGDNEARPALHQVEHRVLDEDFGPGIDRASGLVQNQYLGVGQEGGGR